MTQQAIEYHEIANIFPMMSEDEFSDLTADIKANGLREPIWLYQDKIIDGRNRYRACLAAGIDPKFRTWDGSGSLVSFVVSLNLHRRHLTSSQRAMIAPDVKRALAEEIAQLERSRKQHQNDSTFQVIEKSTPRNATEEAARLVGTNRQYVADAERIIEAAPELAQKVRNGDMTITQARREVAKQAVRESPALPSDKYRLIYADPPWKYGDQLTENYGSTKYHYPSMSIEQLCELPIKDLADDNAVLFLWVTSPLLEECFEVIRAWGFKYKSSFVWDKIRHNFGHYNSVRHELLLVCTRGSCPLEVQQLHDSVVSIERTESHSEKPAYFREMIAGLYPSAKKIELFARGQYDGWEAWGNQA